MSYGDYTKSLYRNGYRPMGETNTFAATHLGMTPFAPELLRGMGADPFRGQHSRHPFSESGGYVLRGRPPAPSVPYRVNRRGPAPHVRRRGMGAMGDMVPDQSLVTYQGTWQNTETQTASDVIAAVSAALLGDGLAVRNSSSNAGILGSTSLLGFAEQITFNVTLQLQVNNGMGFADPNDIISVVRHEVYVATGQFPSADSVPAVQVPGSPVSVSTGQPPVAGAPATDITGWLTQNAQWLALGLGAIALLPMFFGKR